MRQYGTQFIINWYPNKCIFVWILAGLSENDAKTQVRYIPSIDNWTDIGILVLSNKRGFHSMHARVLYRLWCTCVCQSETDLINSRSIVSGCVIETINSWFTCGTVTMRPYYLIGWKGGPMPAEGSEGEAEVFGIHATLYTFTFISPKSVALLLSYIFFIFHATYIIHNLVDEIERSSICWASLSLGLKGNWYAYAVPKKKTYSENCRQMSNICISKYTPQEWRFTVWLQRCVQNVCCWYSG